MLTFADMGCQGESDMLIWRWMVGDYVVLKKCDFTKNISEERYCIEGGVFKRWHRLYGDGVAQKMTFADM